jgi:signal transduction histidine kinase
VNTPPIILIYFIYGLAFFSMGLLVMVEGGRSSDARLRRALRPLAAFGLIHSVNEWMEMFIEISRNENGVVSDWFSGLRLAMLAFSFVSLAAFGSYLMAVRERSWRLILLVPLGLEALWVFGLIFIKGQYPLPEVWTVADTWTRYSLAIPAASLAAVGLVVQQRIFRKAGLVSFGRDALWAAIAFGWYGLVGQLFVHPTVLFPSNFLNEDLFHGIVGIPVQLFRAIMAGIAAIFVIRFLRAFQVENENRIAILQEARLKEARQREKLRGELFKRVVTAQESERQRIARELHDETGQALTAIGLGLRGLSSSLDASNKDLAKQNLHQLTSLTAHSLDELQRLITDLRPSHLDDLGLSSALRWYASSLQERFNLPVIVNFTGEEQPLSAPIRIALFRIAQEALTNIIKHAQATSAWINVSFLKDRVNIQIKDNGRGFEVGAEGPTNRMPWGLKGMEERSKLLGGQFRINSSKKSGTLVDVSIPYIQEESDENQAVAG